jgi:hypothetical protein
MILQRHLDEVLTRTGKIGQAETIGEIGERSQSPCPLLCFFLAPHWPD